MNESRTLRRLLMQGVAVACAAAVAYAWLAGGADTREPVSADAPAGVERVPPAWPPAYPYQPPQSASRGGDVELCGHGVVATDAIPHDLEASADATLLHEATTLQRSASPMQRMLGMATLTVLAWTRQYAEATQSEPGCLARPACADKARADAAQAALPAAETLARFAASSRDPAVYASGLLACRLFAAAAGANACASLRAEQWAQLDPENGYAWLEVARAAAQRKDVRGIDDAMLRASRGRRFAWPFPPFSDLLAGRPPPHDAVDALAVARVLEIRRRWAPVDDYGAISSYCNREAMQDASRKALCGDFASLLVDKDGSLLGMTVGGAVGERAGWHADRVAAVAAQRAAIGDALAREQPGVDMLSCDGAARARAFLAELQNGGELVYARRLLAGGAQTARR